MLPFYNSYGPSIEAIPADNGTECKGRPMIHMCEIFLEPNGIEHRTCKVGNTTYQWLCGKVNRTVPDEFFRTAFRKKFYDSLQALQKDLDKWLHHYNYERPHRGYHNKGRKPIETFEMGKKRRENPIKEAA